MSWVDRFEAEKMLPYRQRGYSQSRRDRLARALRQLRRERSEGVLDAS